MVILGSCDIAVPSVITIISVLKKLKEEDLGDLCALLLVKAFPFSGNYSYY